MEKLERSSLLNSAAVTGAVLGAISGGYMLITSLLTGVRGAGVIGTVLWVAKFAGCIWIMLASMRSLVRRHEGVTNANTLVFGILAAAFSATITAAVAYVSSEFLFQDLVSDQLATVYQTYSQMMDSNTMQVLDKVIENYSMISFFTQLFWCFIYGMVLSFILSGKVPRKDPFAGFEGNESESEQEE